MCKRPIAFEDRSSQHFEDISNYWSFNTEPFPFQFAVYIEYDLSCTINEALIFSNAIRMTSFLCAMIKGLNIWSFNT